MVDDVMIEQVLLNLIRNAIGAMREVHPMHRRVRIVTRLNLDDDVEVRVIDSGCGVTSDQESRLFEPLHDKADGLGVGLAICLVPSSNTTTAGCGLNRMAWSEPTSFQ